MALKSIGEQQIASIAEGHDIQTAFLFREPNGDVSSHDSLSGYTKNDILGIVCRIGQV